MMHGIEGLIEAMSEVKSPCDYCPNRETCAKGYACSDYFNFATAFQSTKPMRPVNRVPRKDIYKAIFETPDPDPSIRTRFVRLNEEEARESVAEAQRMLDMGVKTTELPWAYSTIKSRAMRFGIKINTYGTR